MSFRTRRFVKENFGSEVRLEPAVMAPSQVEEAREESALIEKQIDGVLIEQELSESVESDAALLEDISESIGDVEISKEHDETLQLVTEHFSRKWGVEQRYLGRESITGVPLSVMGQVVGGMLVGVAAVCAALSVVLRLTTIYLFNKLYPKASILENISDTIEDNNELLKGPLISDRSFKDLGKSWIKPLTKGSVFIAEDPVKFKSEVEKISDPSVTIAEIEEIISVMDSGDVAKAVELSDKYLTMYPESTIPVFNNKLITIGTDEIGGKKVIVSAKAVKSGEKAPRFANTFPMTDAVDIVDLLKATINNYTGDTKLREISSKAGDLEKKISKIAKHGSDEEKVTASICGALLNIVTHERLLAAKALIDGGTDFLEKAIKERSKHFKNNPNLI